MKMSDENKSSGSPPAIPELAKNNEKWLWVDPYLKDAELSKRTNVGSVLLAEDITRYILDYNILVNQKDFTEGKEIGAKLKGASYTMTPDPDDAWTFEKNVAIQKVSISLSLKIHLFS
jgi:hypothetical protein